MIPITEATTEQLEQEIARRKAEGLGWYIKIGTGAPARILLNQLKVDVQRIGNWFPTEALAHHQIALNKAKMEAGLLNRGWMPEIGNAYKYWNCRTKEVHLLAQQDYPVDYALFQTGNCFSRDVSDDEIKAWAERHPALWSFPGGER